MRYHKAIATVVTPGLTRKLLLPVVTLLSIVGCTKSSSFAGGESLEEGELPQAVVNIQASLDETPGTKALVNFSSNVKYGIFTCISVDNPAPNTPATPYERFKPSIWNAQADGAGTSWTYRNVASYSTGDLYSSGGSKFVLLGRNDNLTADLYAYAPWTLSAYESGPTAIPFSRETDLMYAVQNVANENRNLNPASPSDLSASFHFKHVMARLRFHFRLKNDNTTMGISLASIKDNNPAGGTVVLYSSGKFNAINGTLNDLTSVEELTGFGNQGTCTVTYNADPAVYNGAMTITLAPTPVSEDDELTITFKSGAITLPPFVLKKEQVKHSDGSTYGFKAGFIYHFYFTLDNYVHFDGFNIQEWGDREDNTLTHGVI